MVADHNGENSLSSIFTSHLCPVAKWQSLIQHADLETFMVQSLISTVLVSLGPLLYPHIVLVVVLVTCRYHFLFFPYTKAKRDRIKVYVKILNLTQECGP